MYIYVLIHAIVMRISLGCCHQYWSHSDVFVLIAEPALAGCAEKKTECDPHFTLECDRFGCFD
jgi:hypothetical protein